MDIEMVQKINKLAVDLLNQGLTTSRIEAVKKAEEMLSRDGSKGLSDIAEAQPMQRTAQKPTPAPQQATLQVKHPDVEALKSAMVKNNDYFVKTFKELQSTLSGLHQEVAGLKQDLHSLKKEAAAQKGAQPSRTLNQVYDQAEIARPTEEKPAQKAESRQSHPRQGSYSPGDVSVEKIFYMGKK
jgi:regulator of replication initiation timing